MRRNMRLHAVNVRFGGSRDVYHMGGGRWTGVRSGDPSGGDDPIGWWFSVYTSGTCGRGRDPRRASGGWPATRHRTSAAAAAAAG